MGNKIIHFNGSLFLPRNEIDKVTATFYLKIWKKTSELWQKVRITLSIFNNVAETENFLAIMGLHLTILTFFPLKTARKKSELLDKILQLSFLFFYLAEMGFHTLSESNIGWSLNKHKWFLNRFNICEWLKFMYLYESELCCEP